MAASGSPRASSETGRRPSRPPRDIINGILWILATGAPWRDLPRQYGSWHTVSSRFYRWRRAGIWQHIFAALQQQADRRLELDWRVHFIDSTIVRAHQHAAGARKCQGSQALGRSRADGQGQPLVVVVTAGERHDQTAFEVLMTHGAVKRAKRGRPRCRPYRLVADKGYSSQRIRTWLRQHAVRHTIPHKQNEHRGGLFERAAYRERNRIERLINRLKQFRRVATRYDKLAANYLALVTLAASVTWL